MPSFCGDLVAAQALQCCCSVLHATIPSCYLRRLVAQHLRLAARRMPHNQKLAFAGQEKVWKAAIDAAKAQELALHQRAATKQVRRVANAVMLYLRQNVNSD